MKTLIVTGDREWADKDTVSVVLFGAYLNGYRRLVHGAARGLDRLAAEVGKSLGLEPEPYPYIGTLGRAGGAVRNQQMLDSEPDADLVLAFHDRLEESRGTRDMVRRSRRACREVRHFTTSGACQDAQCICRRAL